VDLQLTSSYFLDVLQQQPEDLLLDLLSKLVRSRLKKETDLIAIGFNEQHRSGTIIGLYDEARFIAPKIVFLSNVSNAQEFESSEKP
jgi:hypothetical protein